MPASAYAGTYAGTDIGGDVATRVEAHVGPMQGPMQGAMQDRVLHGLRQRVKAATDGTPMPLKGLSLKLKL